MSTLLRWSLWLVLCGAGALLIAVAMAYAVMIGFDMTLPGPDMTAADYAAEAKSGWISTAAIGVLGLACVVAGVLFHPRRRATEFTELGG